MSMPTDSQCQICTSVDKRHTPAYVLTQHVALRPTRSPRNPASGRSWDFEEADKRKGRPRSRVLGGANGQRRKAHEHVRRAMAIHMQGYGTRKCVNKHLTQPRIIRVKEHHYHQLLDLLDVGLGIQGQVAPVALGKNLIARHSIPTARKSHKTWKLP